RGAALSQGGEGGERRARRPRTRRRSQARRSLSGPRLGGVPGAADGRQARLKVMRVAAISDIHGNLPALEAVLAEVEREKPDLIVVCGDVASGPMPSETIELLKTLHQTRFVQGNADRGLIEEFDGKPTSAMPGPFADWCAAQLHRAHRHFLASLQPKVA